MSTLSESTTTEPADALIPAKRLLRRARVIADFLGVSVRQVHRYIKDEGLPAWSEKGRGSPLIAERAEVLDWLRKRREVAQG